MAQPAAALPLEAPELLTAARTAPLAPIDAQERIQLIDVLRGCALFGVLLANMAWINGEDIALTPERAAALPTARYDLIAKYLIAFFVDNKANTIFAFLFGLGFAVQLIRATERGFNVLPTYMRRLLVLLCIGVAHMFLIWFGDILHLYAVMGFMLILFRKRSNKTLLILGTLFAVLPFALLDALPWLLLHASGSTYDAAEAATGIAVQQAMDARRAIFQHGSCLAVVREHIRFNWEDYFSSGFAAGFAVYALGRFLIGFYVGRKRLLHEAHLHLPLFRRLLKWGLVFGVIGNGLYTLMEVLADRDLLNEASGWRVVAALPLAVGIPALSCFYLSTITILFHTRPAWHRRLLYLAPVGRMALTNYLTQSLCYVLIFYGYAGLGLLDRIGISVCIPLALAIFGAQIWFSGWWLRRFRFGPCEWLWRTLTYGARQPMRGPQPQTT
jgi:uncharacterized protein